MSLERREGSYISPENATVTILTACGIKQVRLTNAQNRSEETDLKGFKDTLNVIRYNMGEIGQDLARLGLVGIDHRNFQTMPAFRGEDGNFYMLRGLEVSHTDLQVVTAIQTSNTQLEKGLLSPLDLLARMPEA